MSSGNNSGSALFNCNSSVDNCYFTRFTNAFLNFEGVVNNSIFNTNTTAISHQNSGYKGDVKNCTIFNSNIGISGDYKVRNSIIVNSSDIGLSKTNSESNYNNVWGNINANYTDGAIPGANDIHRNPLFAQDGYMDDNNTPEDTNDDFWVEGDYHLKSEIGRWNGTEWVVDALTSPCLDAGDPADSLGQEPIPNGGRINMGAYGGTVEASKSPNGDGIPPDPICTIYPLSDVDGNCKVDYLDFIIMVSEWLDCNLDPIEACL